MPPRERPVPTSRSAAGYSLLELLVAIFILGFTSIGLFLMASMTTAGNTRSKDHAAAAALAGQKLEELKNLGFEGLAAGSFSDPYPLTAAGQPDPDAIFQRSWTVDDGTFNGLSGREIVVSVTWTGGDSVTLRTVVADIPDDLAGQPSAYVTSWDQKR